ncbi:MAG: PilZ domain-containing protein [Candidatus Omnitrophica bacterium]|nr:PilZ domain-containing protein [Candidatus Omnitrophota bacterium]
MPEQFDQREFIRVPDSSEITYGTAALSKKKKSKIQDISQSGIRFMVEEKFAPGDIIDVTLSLEQVDFSFAAKATVRWINEIVKNRRYEIGVKFVDLPEADVIRLIDYINSIKRFSNYR